MNVLKLTVNESLEPTVIISNIEIYADSSYDFSAAPEPPAEPEAPAGPEAPVAPTNPPSPNSGDNMVVIFALMLCVMGAFIAIKTKHPLKTK